ncbi:hypothetical protein F5Y02DRAFT_401970 [Annulohypoxylon stygium]|nr:hypothetical protein F5Y02DRAFT_401970 [Annulohypoxylon stygium]
MLLGQSGEWLPWLLVLIGIFRVIFLGESCEEQTLALGQCNGVGGCWRSGSPNLRKLSVLHFSPRGILGGWLQGGGVRRYRVFSV